MKREYHCLSKNEITTGKYSIRTIQDSDIEQIRLWRNAQIDILRQSKPINHEEQQQYYQKEIWPSMKDMHPKNILFSYLLDRVLIGYGGLVHINWEHKRAEISFLLDPRYSRDKIQYSKAFSNFLNLLKIIAFDDLLFERLYTETFAIRDLHILVLESSGFLCEGVMKNHVFIDNCPVDAIIHGCLRSYSR